MGYIFVSYVVVNDAVQKKFGERLRLLRNKRGVSQEEFAARCGLDRTYISGIERGRRNPSLRNLKKIAAELGVTMSQLFKGLG